MPSRTTIPFAVGMCSLTVLAVAGTAHFETGPTIADYGTTLAVSGSLSGMEARDIVVLVRAKGTASVECTDPKVNGTPVTVDLPATVHALGTQAIPASHIIGGRAFFRVITKVPELASAKAAGCPGAKWKADASEVTFSSVTIRVIQGDRVVLEQKLTP